MKSHLEVLRANWLSFVILVAGIGLFSVWLKAPPAEMVSAPNGSIRFCGDCQATSPCTPDGTGAMAIRLNGEWDCAESVSSGRYLQTTATAINAISTTNAILSGPSLTTNGSLATSMLPSTGGGGSGVVTSILPLSTGKVGDCLRTRNSGEMYWGTCE